MSVSPAHPRFSPEGSGPLPNPSDLVRSGSTPLEGWTVGPSDEHTELPTRTRLRRWVSRHRISLGYGLTAAGGYAIAPIAGSGEPYGWVVSALCACLSTSYAVIAVRAVRQGD